MGSELVHITINAENVLDPQTDIMEPMWCSVDIYGTYEEYEQGLQPFTEAQRTIFAITWLEREVNNGGFDQFYFNSTGIVWEDAKRGFAAIGCTRIVELIEESVRRMGGRPSFDRKERWEQMDKNNAEFDDLDSIFYQQDYSDLVAKYVKEHAEEFYFDGDIMKSM